MVLLPFTSELVCLSFAPPIVAYHALSNADLPLKCAVPLHSASTFACEALLHPRWECLRLSFTCLTPLIQHQHIWTNILIEHHALIKLAKGPRALLRLEPRATRKSRLRHMRRHPTCHLRIRTHPAARCLCHSSRLAGSAHCGAVP